ncbi:MAG: OmpA family protein [Polaromonas sp.]|uniref:OmpA family protein n=1 Tax=Polaromonas sp. TaxID=1869339 RepID=UPI002736C36F|nr:OmpA family protein [Polaromonas sp.]MDP2818835.1 OmpA family protein [Polaromonas sp.]
MFSQSDDEQQGWVLGLVFGLIALVVAVVLGLAISRVGASRPDLPPSAAAPAPAAVVVPVSAGAIPVVVPASAALSAQAVSDAASITVEYGVVKFYFASGEAELAAGAAEALVDVIKGVRGGKKIVISGFHDTRGNAVRNAELARQRALAVREALMAAGVADHQIRLEKPVQTAGTGSDAEARRVEISLQ